jgi:hypothetical protein
VTGSTSARQRAQESSNDFRARSCCDSQSRAPRQPQQGCVPKPKVAATRLLWVIGQQTVQPQRGWGSSVPARAAGLGRNAIGIVSISERAPKGLCKNKIRLSGGILTPGRTPFEARQIRSPNPKSETNSKSESSKAQNGARLPGFAIRISVLRVCFGFRVSDFGFCVRSRSLCGGSQFGAVEERRIVD